MESHAAPHVRLVVAQEAASDLRGVALMRVAQAAEAPAKERYGRRAASTDSTAHDRT